MNYFKINNRGFWAVALSLVIAFSNVDNIFSEQTLTYGNYPIVRGVTNPQESVYDFDITDGGINLRQMVLVRSLGLLSVQNKKINPNKNLTNKEMLEAMVKLSKNDADIPENDENRDALYLQKAIEMKLVTQEEIDKIGNEKYMQNSPNMKTLNANFSKVMNALTKYNTPPDKKATRLDFANMIYNNKKAILENENIEIFSGQITTKSQIVEDSVKKSLITVKLDKNHIIKRQDEIKEQENKENLPIEKIEYTTNQSHKITEENKKDSTVVSYINIISNKDVPILTPYGITLDTNNLWEQSQINVYVKNNKTLYVEQYNVETKEVVGVLESIISKEKELEKIETSKDKDIDNSSSIVKIKDYDNKVHIYKLHPDVKILQYSGELGDNTAISKPVKPEQLSYGQDVSLTVRNSTVTVLKAYVPVEEELNSYVAPESSIKTGVVLDIDSSNIKLTDNTDYTIGSSTLIMKNAVISDYKSIKDGDRIKMYFDDIYSNVPSKIEIEGPQRQADKILKATVGPYMVSKKSLNLKNVKQLQNGQWVNLNEDEKSYETIKIRGDIYANSNKVNSNKLKNYQNQEIYAVIAKNQGIPTIEKAKIRIGDSLKFVNSIDNIDYSQNTMQIDTNLVKFDDSTIIVKDSNIVQSGNLEKNITTNVETNLLKDAQIIIQTGASLNVDKKNDYPYKIYRGTLRGVFDYSILLGNDIENGRKVNHFYMWQGGVWNRISEGKTTPRLNFTEQTKIYDHDNEVALTVDEIREKKYDLNSFGIRPDYFNRQVYVITKDDVVFSMGFIKAQGYVQVNTQNMIVAKGVGVYQNEENKGGNDNKKQTKIQKILVKNIYTYNSNTNKLDAVPPIITTDTSTQEAKSSPVRKIINIDKASVILNGKVIQKTSMEALKDKDLVIIYKQNRDKKTTDNIEELDAIAIIAK